MLKILFGTELFGQSDSIVVSEFIVPWMRSAKSVPRNQSPHRIAKNCYTAEVAPRDEAQREIIEMALKEIISSQSRGRVAMQGVAAPPENSVLGKQAPSSAHNGDSPVCGK